MTNVNGAEVDFSIFADGTKVVQKQLEILQSLSNKVESLV
jgi:hypothetical protein